MFTLRDFVRMNRYFDRIEHYDRIRFYYQHKEFIDSCMSYMKLRGLSERDAEEVCYELAAQ